MAIVTEISFADMFAGKSLPDSPARKAFRASVETIADKARAALPQLNTRVDKAVQIVLNGDIAIDADGQGKIASQTNGNVEYLVGKGDCCACKDHAKAPKHLCKHVLSYHIYTRARKLASEKLEACKPESPPTVDAPVASQPVDAVTPDVPTVPTVPAAETLVQPESVVSPIPLPEAPASANVYVTIAGRNVQLTLRDHDEKHLLSRMEKLLERFPSDEKPVPEASTTPPEHWCPIHQVPMKRYSNEKGSWFSHRLDNKTWCNGKGRST